MGCGTSPQAGAKFKGESGPSPGHASATPESMATLLLALL